MMTSVNAPTKLPYRELVRPSLGAFLPTLLVAPTIWLAMAPINATLGLIAGLLANAIVIATMLGSSPRIFISEELLIVGKAKIPLEFVTGVDVIDRFGKRSATGPDLDARAFLQIQPSVPGLVRIHLNDPWDPTPYWLVSSRSPDLVKSVITRPTA